MEDSKYQTLEPGALIIKAAGEYVQVPAGEPIKAHIDSVKKTQQPSYDDITVLVPKVVIGFKIDETDGEGQVYSGWFTPSLNEKAKLTKLVKALFPSKDIAEVDPTEFIGLPVRIVLSEPNDNGRQNIESYLKPTSDQKVVETAAEVAADELETLFDEEDEA